MRSVRAASGPYAAELSASKPKMGMPAAVPMHSARAWSEARGLPIRKSRKDMGGIVLQVDRIAKNEFQQGETDLASSQRIMTALKFTRNVKRRWGRRASRGGRGCSTPRERQAQATGKRQRTFRGHTAERRREGLQGNASHRALPGCQGQRRPRT